jgi:hypothetical protein
MTLTERLEDILDPYVADEDKRVVSNLIKAAVLHHMPEPIDIESKYEADPVDGVWISLPKNEKAEADLLDYLFQFGQDVGYNGYYLETRDYLKLDNTVVS